MKKVYAVQVPVDQQESPLFFPECFPEDVAVFGNRDYKAHFPENFEEMVEALNGDFSGDMDDVLNGVSPYYNTIREVVEDYFPEKLSGEKYTDKELSAIVKALDYLPKNERFCYCDLYRVISGKEYDYRVLRGTSQSDWNYLFYPVEDYSRSALERFESEYFNTGTEWTIHEGENIPSRPEEVEGYSLYVTDYDARQEIAECCGTTPENVMLWIFDHYRRIPVYKEV